MGVQFSKFFNAKTWMRKVAFLLTFRCATQTPQFTPQLVVNLVLPHQLRNQNLLEQVKIILHYCLVNKQLGNAAVSFVLESTLALEFGELVTLFRRVGGSTAVRIAFGALQLGQLENRKAEIASVLNRTLDSDAFGCLSPLIYEPIGQQALFELMKEEVELDDDEVDSFERKRDILLDFADVLAPSDVPRRFEEIRDYWIEWEEKHREVL